MRRLSTFTGKKGFDQLFQPVMELQYKIRDKGKVYRKYDTPKTPYQRLMESPSITEETKEKLKTIYLSLNPAELKRKIDEKLNELYQVYQEKNNLKEVKPDKKQTPHSVTSYMTQQ